MTTTMVREPAPAPARLDLRVARRSREALVFGGAVARRPRARARRRVPAPRARRRRSASTRSPRRSRWCSGSPPSPSSRPRARRCARRSRCSSGPRRRSTAACTSSTSRIRARRASDLTGALAAAAGFVLIGLAVAIPWLHRGAGPASPRRRWALPRRRRPGRLLAFFFTVVPMSIGLNETHKFREPVGAPPSADYREVAFEATDGVELAGWYRPTRNGATILVVHGGGSDRARLGRARPHARAPRLRRAALRRPRPRARARAPRTPGAGAGPRTSPARSRS